MASKRTSMLSLSQLLAEVDMLERDLKDLSREAQRGEDFNNQLQEIVDRDLKNVEAIQKETNRISQEIIEWDSKERFLTEAINTGIQSSQLLVQMETQARNKLEEERRATSQLKEQLRSEVGTFAKKVEKVEIAYGKIPEYRKIIQVEERIRSKTAMLQSMEREKKYMMGQMEVAAKDVAEDREAWRDFKASCLNLAEQWLKMSKLKKAIVTLSKEKEELNLHIKSIESERKSALDKLSLLTSVNNGPNYEAERSNDHASSAILSVQKTLGPNVDSALYKSLTNSCSQSPHSADTDNVITNLEKPPLMISRLSSISGNPSLPPPPTMFKPPSTSTYVPPTPKTKKLHLQLGTSLLSKKKTGSVSVSATVPTDIRSNNPTSTLQDRDGDCKPSTTDAIRIEKDNAKVSSSQIHETNKPVKMKSFKLGLTSLFGRKKPSSVAQGSKPNEEFLARTPTLPHHEQESVRDIHAKENVEENMDVDEEDVGMARTKSSQGESVTTRNKCAEYVQKEKEVDTLSTGDKTASANYLSCRPTVEEVVHIDDGSTTENAANNQQLSVASEISPTNVVPTPPIPNPRVNTTPMEVSSSPSPREGRQAMCVSPGTALSDEKRKAVLQQLLESPQTTSASGSNIIGGVQGFGVIDNKGSSVNGSEKNDDYFEGEKENNDLAGDVQSISENSFSFFGGGSGKMAEENAGEESFAFSFGGVGGEQEDVQEGGDTFGFSFGGDFEDQMGGGGFSLF